jgi:predicted alpha/beta superfamily hydrolase
MTAPDLHYRTHDVEEHLIASRSVGQSFRIRVLQPISRANDSERFPVVYLTDGDFFFGGAATLASSLQVLGETPRFILVGIGYDTAELAPLLRWRDFATHTLRAQLRDVLQTVIDAPFASYKMELSKVTASTDATEFLSFMAEELIPFIDRRYPTVAGERGLVGYSLGGALGLYSLFTQPHLFEYYILGSPSISYREENFGIDLTRDFLASRKTLSARLFMSVGELEEFGRGHHHLGLVSGYYRLASFLTRAAIPGLDLSLRVFAGESHATSWTLSFSHGLRQLLGPAESVPFWPDDSRTADA